MTQPAAFLFDLNGTMIDDMDYHIKAWYHVLNNDLGANLSWKEVKSHMYGKNTELLVRVFGSDRFSIDEMNHLSVEKEKRYQEAFFPELRLIPGLKEFLAKAKENNIRMAIGSAAIPFNIDFVLDNLDIRHYFGAIVSADDVIFSKPDPETFRKAAELLQVEPERCVVFEDAPKGVESAMHAGIPCVVLTTLHEKEEFPRYPNIKGFIRDYNDPFCSSLFGSAFTVQDNHSN
jgi:HAD superfamily hydrolase (TIGR01509 family)